MGGHDRTLQIFRQCFVGKKQPFGSNGLMLSALPGNLFFMPCPSLQLIH